MSIAVVSSRIATQRVLHRCFASCSTAWAESSSSSSSDSGQGSSKGKEVDDSRKPLYQNSKAALRPRANARSPLYANKTLFKSNAEVTRGAKIKNTSSPSRKDDQSADASYIAALRSPAARIDDRLRQLYAQLGSKSSTMKDVVECVEVCKYIKQHLKKISPEGTTIAPPIYVYEVLLGRLSSVGAYDVCLEVIQEMRDTGFDITISILNFLLKAAVQAGDDAFVEEALSEIGSLHGGFDFTEQPSSSSQHPTILSQEITRNWNPKTYQHLIKRCYYTHNPEYALLLIGSASYRSQKGGDGLSFLSEVLVHVTVVDIVMILCHAREARLVAELGQWFHNGVAARKVSVQSWMTILRCCAEQVYLPGIKIAWDYAVNQGLLTPDDGLIIGAINAAAREGDVEFVEKIQKYHKIRLEQANLSLQEWHLTPLFEAHCVNKDYFKAIQSIVDTARTTHTNYTIHSLIPLSVAARTSKKEIDAAYEAFLAAGRDPTKKGGVSILVLNSLLKAANGLNKSAMVFKLYRSRKLVRNEKSPPNAALPPLPIMIETESDEVADLKREQDRVKALTDTPSDRWTPGSVVEAPTRINSYEHSLQPDIDTFNEVLYAAAQIQNHQVGQIFLRHMNAAKVQANERTYELAIRLELTRDDYQDAFRLLEECKKRGMIPNQWTYRYIGLRCLQENDPRWIMISKEMMEMDYTLGGPLTYAMQRDGHMSVEEARRYERPGSNYGPLRDDYSSR